MIKQGFTFDDLLLIPRYSEIKSRSEVDTSVDLGKGFTFKLPIVSANMKNVTGIKMAEKLSQMGGLPILHRFEDNLERINRVVDVKKFEGLEKVGFSVGVGEHEKDVADQLIKKGAKIICVDVAHGDHVLALDMVSFIAEKYPEVLLIAGNVATAQGAEKLAKTGVDVVKVGIGGGCFAAGTRVLMANGTYKNIEEIKPGDRIINKNGKPKSVKAAFCTGVKKVLKIRNSLFYKPTFVTPDHKYWVGDLNSVSKFTLESKGYSKLLEQQSKTTPKTSKIKWKEVADLKQDCLLMPKSINFEMGENFTINLRKRFSGNKPDNFLYKKDIELKPSYELGFIFGTFLGDGHAMEAEHNGSNIGAVYWYFNKDESDLAEKLSKCIKSCFNKEISIKEEGSIIKCEFYYKPFANFLSQFDKKHLPSHLLVKNYNYLNGILDGLIVSNGNVEEGGRVRFSNTSSQLIELFSVLSYLVKGVFSNNEKPKWPTSGNLPNVENKNCKPGLVASNIVSGKKRLTDNYQVNKLLDKEVVCLELPVYDLTIDCETHSFIANNAIVHNSLCTTRIETGNGVPQMTALADAASVARPSICRDKKFSIIADGGVRRAGDAVKALCFADMVMVGSMLAGTEETPGELFVVDGQLCKEYAGSSTHKTNHIEGVKANIPYKGKVENIITKTMEGIRSGMSYQGVDNLEKLKKVAEFIQITSAGLIESHPHIK